MIRKKKDKNMRSEDSRFSGEKINTLPKIPLKVQRPDKKEIKR